jgi:transcriptional regulator with XRE-family HTH domain
VNSLVAENIRAIRETLGWSQTRLADQAGLPQSAISRLETGERGISVTDLARIADAFEIDPAILLRPLGRILVLPTKDGEDR